MKEHEPAYIPWGHFPYEPIDTKAEEAWKKSQQEKVKEREETERLDEDKTKEL